MFVLVRYKCPDVITHASIGDASISIGSVLLSFILFDYLVSFKVFGETMAGRT